MPTRHDLTARGVEEFEATGKVVPGTFKVGRSSEKGTPYLQLGIEICDGPWAGLTVPWKGYITKNTTDRTIESLRFLGWQNDDIEHLTTEQLPGACRAVVKADGTDAKGVNYYSVQWINALGGGMPKVANPIEGADLRKLSAALRARAQQIAKRPPVPVPEPSEASAPSLPAAEQGGGGYSAAGHGEYNSYEPPPPGDDDIPF